MWFKLYPPGARKSRFWTARGEDVHGREWEISCKTTDKVAARRLARKFARERDRRAPDPSPPPESIAETVHTFRDAAQRYIDFRDPSDVDVDRIERLVNWIDPATGQPLGDRDIKECGQDELVRFARSVLPGRAGSTLNREAKVPYAAVVHYGAHLKWCGDWRVKGFKELEVERPPAAPDVFPLLIANAERPPVVQTYAHKKVVIVDRQVAYKRALLILLQVRGLRISDNLALKRRRDLDLPNGLIRVTIGKARNKVVWLPLPPEAVAALANLPSCDGYVFPWRHRSSVYKWLTPLRKKLGVRFTPHMARHALATEMLEGEVDPRIVQEAGGWKSLKTVQRIYQHVATRLVREADARRTPLNPVGKKVGNGQDDG